VQDVVLAENFITNGGIDLKDLDSNSRLSRSDPDGPREAQIKLQLRSNQRFIGSQKSNMDHARSRHISKRLGVNDQEGPFATS
jgi:hypothetical protein